MKTRRINIIIAIFILTPFILLSQKNELIHWLDGSTNSKGNWIGGTASIYKENDNLKILLGENKLSRLLSINPNTGSSSELVFNLSYPSGKTFFSEILEINQKKYAIFNEINKKEKKFKIYSLLLNNNCCGELTLIYEHDFIKNGKKEQKTYIDNRKDAETTFRKSKDKSKIGYINQRTLNPKGKTDKIQVAVFDSNLSLLWEKAIDFPYDDKKLIIENFIVNNDGKSIFLMTAYSKGKHKLSTYFLYHITQNKTQKTELKLQEDCHPTSIAPTINYNNNTLTFRGLYRNKKDRRFIQYSPLGLSKKTGNISGVFWGTTKLENLKSPEFHYHHFSKEERQKIRGKVYYASDIHFFDNGNVHILFDGKQNLDGLVYPNYHGAFSIPTLCEYNELISCTFGTDGELNNTNIIERKLLREYQGKGHSTVYNSNSTFIIFDSSITKRQAKKLDIKIMGINLHRMTELIQIDSSGTIKKEYSLSNTKTSSFSFEDTSAIIMNDKLLFGGKIQKNVQGPGTIYGKRNFRFGYINLQDLFSNNKMGK